MSRAAWSILIFGIYVTVLSAAILVAPTKVIALLGLPSASEGWLRTVALLALVIGCYDMTASRIDSRTYYRMSIAVRLGFAAGVGWLVVTRQMPIAALPLGVIDIVGAAWTASAMRADAKTRLTQRLAA